MSTAEAEITSIAGRIEHPADNKTGASSNVYKEVQQLHDRYKDNPAAYRQIVDGVYNKVYGDAKHDPSLNSLLPQIELTDSKVDAEHVGNDHAKFNDGKDYGGKIAVEEQSGIAKSWTSSDGRSGMVAGPNGSLTSFDAVSGADGQQQLRVTWGDGHYDYPQGTTAAAGPDGIQIDRHNGLPPITVKADGTEVTQFQNGTTVTRNHPGGDVTDYTSASPQGPVSTRVPDGAKDIAADQNGLTYTKDGQKVTVNPSNSEETTELSPGGLKVTKDKPGGNITSYTIPTGDKEHPYSQIPVAGGDKWPGGAMSDKPITADQSGIHYTNAKEQPVTINNDGSSDTQIGGTTVHRQHAVNGNGDLGDVSKVTTKDGATIEKHDDGHWYVSGNGKDDWKDCGGHIHINATGDVEYGGTGLTSFKRYVLGSNDQQKINGPVVEDIAT